MKLSQQQLSEIIRKEIRKSLNEINPFSFGGRSSTPPSPGAKMGIADPKFKGMSLASMTPEIKKLMTMIAKYKYGVKDWPDMTDEQLQKMMDYILLQVVF